MICRPLIFMLGLAAACGPGAAFAEPEHEQKVRLDDLALPAVKKAGPAIEQLSPPLVKGVPDRSGDTAPIIPPEPQINHAGAKGGAVMANVSGRKDSKPHGVEALEGSDACDPQAPLTSQDERCRRILELRADEFHATEAPTLSPEERLLAAQDQSALRSVVDAARNTPDDADNQTTQELAAIVRESEAPPPPPVQPDPVAPTDAIGDLLNKVFGQVPLPNQ